MLIEIKCETCNKLFQRSQNEINRSIKFNRRSFCSRTCFRHEPKTKINNCFCSYCNKDFYLRPSKFKLSKSGLYFCCRDHKDKAQRLGGIKEIQPYHYGTTNNYRKTAFLGYEKICNRCKNQNILSNILVVHHIDKDRTNNELSNLEILCPNCHAVEHLDAKALLSQLS